jgi:hypothetical protein
MKSYQARLIEVGWDLPADGLGHLVLDKFPANMNNIADMITHSGKELTVDTVIDHLRLHANNQHIRSSGSGTRLDPITLFKVLMRIQPFSQRSSSLFGFTSSNKVWICQKTQ